MKWASLALVIVMSMSIMVTPTLVLKAVKELPAAVTQFNNLRVFTK